jgi:hypothetical protein
VFVREAIPIQAGKNASNANGRASAAEGRPEMYTMAQRIVTAASQGMGLSPGVGAGVLAAVHGPSAADARPLALDAFLPAWIGIASLTNCRTCWGRDAQYVPLTTSQATEGRLAVDSST